MRARALFGVVGLIMGGCAEDASEPTDELDGSQKDGSQLVMVADATQSSDANGGDASVADANVADASSSDASGGDASAAQGCAKRAYKLCEDFESAANNALPKAWTAVMGWGGGTAS